MSVVEVLVRTDEQRMVALRKANRVRTDRSLLKQDLKLGRANVQEILTDPPAYVLSMRVYALLCAMPWYGRVKAARLLNRCRVSQSKTVGGLSDRQRDELVGLLGGDRYAVARSGGNHLNLEGT